jgi:hypothetical protein
MRFMLLFKSDVAPKPDTSPCKQELPEMGKLMTRLRESGVLIFTEGLLPSDTGARVRVTGGGKATVHDGPFAEAKELVAGFAIVEVASKADAVELAKQFLTIAGGGIGDVLEVYVPKRTTN